MSSLFLNLTIIFTILISFFYGLSILQEGSISCIFYLLISLQLLLGFLPLVDNFSDYNSLLVPILIYSFSTLLCIYYHYSFKGIILRKRIYLSYSPWGRNFYLSFFTFFISFAIILMLIKNFKNSLGWWEFRERTGPFEVINTFLSFLLAPLAFIFYERKKIIISIFLVTMAIAVVLLVGSRIPLLCLGVAFFIKFFLIKQHHKPYLILAFSAIIALFTHILSRILRGIGLDVILSVNSLSDFIDLISMYFRQEDFTMINAFSGGESEILLYYIYCFRDSSLFSSFGSLNTLKRIVLLPIPSFLVNKPIDVTTEAWTVAMSKGWVRSLTDYSDLLESAQGSMHFSIWGDAYINAGTLSMAIYPVLIVVLLISLDSFINHLPREEKFLFGSVVGISYAALVRGAVISAMSYILFIFLAIYFLKFLSNIFCKLCAYSFGRDG